MAAPENELGEFLRAGRSRVRPADAGLPGGVSGRRVSGLRREEVAVLAGVSADYYARLEQGRERAPSAQVMDAIARALRLSPDAREHLHRLAGLSPSPHSGDADVVVHPTLVTMLGNFPGSAAYVLGPAFDILATNPVADRLLAPFGEMRNMPRILFTHPAAASVFTDCALLQSATVKALRLNAVRFPDDRRIKDVVAELLEAGDAFRALWQQREVAGLPRAVKVFVPPGFGPIELAYQAFEVVDAPGQILHVGTPEPNSPSAETLARMNRDRVWHT